MKKYSSFWLYILVLACALASAATIPPRTIGVPVLGQSGGPPPATVKFNPGWFIGSDNVNGNSVATGGNGRNLGEIQIIGTTGGGGTYPGSPASPVMGYAPLYDWGNLETTAGSYNFAAVSSDFNTLQQYAPGARMIIQIRWDYSAGSCTDQTSPPWIPSDILGNTGAYGAGPSGGSTSGWGLSGYGACPSLWQIGAAALWRTAVVNRWVNFLQQLANYSFTVTAGPLNGQTFTIDNNPLIEGIFDWAEDSWDFWTGPKVPSDYTDTALGNAFQTEMSSATASSAFQHTAFATFQSFGWSNNGFPNPDLPPLITYASTHRNALSNSDIFGSTSVGSCGALQICAYESYIGNVWNGSAWVSGGTDLRGTMGFMGNVQGYDYQHSTGCSTPCVAQTILNIYAQMQTMHATHGVWDIWDETTGTPSSFVSTYLLPFFNAHAVPNTTRPSNIN